MALVAGALGVPHPRGNEPGLPLYGAHIRLQGGAVAALHPAALLLQQVIQPAGAGGKAGIQVYILPLHQHAGVKAADFPGLAPENRAVRPTDVVVKLKIPRRGVAHCHPHIVRAVQGVVQVVSPVRPPDGIRGEELHLPLGVLGVPGGGVDYPLVPPVSQVLHRGGPAHIVVDAEALPLEGIVAAVDIHPISKYPGLSVGDIFIAGQIGIEGLLFHNVLLA